MEIKEYAEAIAENIKNNHPEFDDIIINTVRKNNNVILHAVIIKNKDSNISPTIYVDPFYNENKSIEEAAEEVLEIYNNNKDIDFSFNEKDIMHFDNVKDKIIAKVYGKKKNEDELDRCPYAQFGDLIVNFFILVNKGDDNYATIKINNKLMIQWNVTLTTIMEYAYKNTPNLMPVKIMPMFEVLKALMPTDIDNETAEQIIGMDDKDDSYMYIISNDTKCNGAFYITDKNALNQMADICGDSFYILPSSIHELIAVPARKLEGNGSNEENLLAMVTEVNATQLSEDEILSNNVYFYNKDEETLYDSEKNVIPFLS